VTVAAVFERYGQTLEQARRLLAHLVTRPLPQIEPDTRQALQTALLSRPESLGDEQRAWLGVLQR